MAKAKTPAGTSTSTRAKSSDVAAANVNQYEAMFLLPAGASAELEKSMSAVRGIIERHGGQVIVLKKWDERKLAYELNRQKRGLYVIAYFRAPGAAVTAIEREVNLSEDMLRVLVTKAEHLNEAEMNAVEPQPIQPREERGFGDRGGYGGGYGGGGYGGDRDRDRGGDRGDRGGDRADRAPRGGDRPPRREDAPAGEPAAKD
jgi:small subunit ribosomal protein S6